MSIKTQQNDVYVTVQLELDTNLLKIVETTMQPNETIGDAVTRLIILGLNSEGVTID